MVLNNLICAILYSIQMTISLYLKFNLFAIDITQEFYIYVPEFYKDCV